MANKKKFNSFQELGKHMGRSGDKGNSDPAPRIPDHCLQGDFFDTNRDGVLKKEFLLDWAKEIADVFKKEDLTTGQLRRFYGEVKRIEGQMQQARRLGRSCENLLNSFYRLPSLAEYAVHRKDSSVKQEFSRFIIENAKRVKDEHDFLDGFVPHFQCVVGFANLRDSNR